MRRAAPEASFSGAGRSSPPECSRFSVPSASCTVSRPSCSASSAGPSGQRTVTPLKTSSTSASSPSAATRIFPFCRLPLSSYSPASRRTSAPSASSAAPPSSRAESPCSSTVCRPEDAASVPPGAAAPVFAEAAQPARQRASRARPDTAGISLPPKRVFFSGFLRTLAYFLSFALSLPRFCAPGMATPRRRRIRAQLPAR